MLRASFIILSIQLSTTVLNAQAFEEAGENQFIDVSVRQLKFLTEAMDLTDGLGDDLLKDSVFTAFPVLWGSYWDDADSFISWAKGIGFSKIQDFRIRSERIDREKLRQYWNQSVLAVMEVTGHVPQGACYVYFGPDKLQQKLNGPSNVFIDLGLSEHFNAAAISELFPHYISKMIFAEQQGFSEDLAYRLLEGGLACYTTYQLHQGAISKAEALGYEDEAYAYCVREEAQLFQMLPKLLLEDGKMLTTQSDAEVAEEAHRLYDIIGYYLGFRIVEGYVDRFGTEAWRSLFTMKPADAIAQSGLLPE